MVSKEITHRNLKPKNILLTEQSEKAVLKITDFGTFHVAIISNGGTDLNTFAGTGRYMAPEVLARKDMMTGDQMLLMIIFSIFYPLL